MTLYVYADTALAALFATARSMVAAQTLPPHSAKLHAASTAIFKTPFWNEFASDTERTKGLCAQFDAFFGQVPATRVAGAYRGGEIRDVKGCTLSLRARQTVPIDVELMLCLPELLDELRAMSDVVHNVRINDDAPMVSVSMAEVCALIEQSTVVSSKLDPRFNMVCIAPDAAAQVLLAGALDSLAPAACVIDVTTGNEWRALPLSCAIDAMRAAYAAAVKRSDAVGTLRLW